MRIPLRLCSLLLLFLGGWGHRSIELPYAGPVPDEPLEASPPVTGSILSGTKSFRPVEPLPWGDVNRRVAPSGGGSPSPEPPSVNGHGSH